MSKVIEIEGHIGHFGDGTGAGSLVDEVKESRKIAQRVHAILKANGVPNSLFEDKVSKSQRDNINALVRYHNKDNDGLVVSYHLNASGKVVDTGIGAEVLYSTQKSLATDLSKAIANAGGFKNRGAKYRDNLGILTGTKEPSIIIETFFVNSREDVTLYKKNFEKICQAIAKVLAEYLNHKIKDKIDTVKVPHRIKSGTYSKKAKAEEAKFLVGKNGIASEKYITLHHSTDSKYYFQTGSYKSKEDAEKALATMKTLKILTNGHVIKA